MSTLSILITGSNQGLGYETARQLSKHAHIRIFISGRDASRVEEALAKIKAEDGCVAIIESVVLDVGDDTSIQAAVQDMKGKLGGAALDVLVVSQNKSLSCRVESAIVLTLDHYRITGP